MLTVHRRFQVRLGGLLREAAERGVKAPKSKLADYCGRKAPSWVSNLLSDRSAHPRLELEDLFDIANFFRVSISELLGAPRKGELTGDEQRLLYAFQVLPVQTQEHFLALIEAASITGRVGSVSDKRRHALSQGINKLLPQQLLSDKQSGKVHSEPAAHVPRDPLVILEQARAQIFELSQNLTRAVAEFGPVTPAAPAPAVARDTSRRRRVPGAVD